MLAKIEDSNPDDDLFKISILGCGERAGAVAFMLLTKVLVNNYWILRSI